MLIKISPRIVHACATGEKINKTNNLDSRCDSHHYATVRSRFINILRTFAHTGNIKNTNKTK